MKQEDLAKLSKILAEKVKESDDKSDKEYFLLDSIDDLVLVWCKEESCLYSQILQNLPFQSNENEIVNVIQSLVLSKPPIWDVKRIIVNKSGTGVLLIGVEGVAVIELPKRWGNPPLFEGGVDVLTCRVAYVAEQFLMCNSHVKIISGDWHPGSLDHSFISVLSSDNYLRLYSLLNLEIPEQAVAVGRSHGKQKEGSKFGVGECVVAFQIGPPLYINDEPEVSTTEKYSMNITDKFNEELERRKRKYQELLWPVFILYNNGDVYYTLSSLSRRNLRCRALYGPLSMQPASFNNYGVDFCSLLVIPSSPVVLVIGNTEGFLHHCVVLESTGTDQTANESQDLQDLPTSISLMNLESSNVYLHVYETVHLNLSYASSAKSSLISPISMVPDCKTPAKYLVCHKEGCHGVYVPLIERLFANDTIFPEGDLESHVEHLLCTRPVATETDCKLMGLCLSPSGTVLVLLNSGNIQSLSLSSSLLPPLPLFHLETTDHNSSLKKFHHESFDEHIRSILHRNSSQPLLVASGGTSSNEAPPEEYLRLVQKVTYTLRENYIRPQVKAREEIKRRQRILLDQKEHLKAELNYIEAERKTLTDKTRDLVEKYEDANEKNSVIMRRLEVAIGSLVRKMPVLSASEKRMLEELQGMSEKQKSFQSQISQIKSKSEWQTNQIAKDKKNEALRKSRSSSLSDNQLTCLKMSLGKESDKLETLVQKIKQIKKEFGM